VSDRLSWFDFALISDRCRVFNNIWNSLLERACRSRFYLLSRGDFRARARWRLAFSVLVVLYALPVQADGVKLATLDWAPYTSPALPEQGMISKILQDAVRQSGHEVSFGFFPWVRAMRTGRDDPDYAGYFPAYWTPQRAQSCNFSEPIGIGQVGLVQRRDNPVHWSELRDLSSLAIGVTAGYSNGSAFDALVSDGLLHVQPAPADVDNMRMVARGRIPVAVVERSVFDYTLLTDPDLHQKRADLEFNSRLIAQLPLYICFKKTNEGARWKQIFDAGLIKIDLLAAQRDFLQTLIALQ
jgi:polar amino acid transport system substrate-binding protein